MTADSRLETRLYAAGLLVLAAAVGFLAGVAPVYALALAAGSVFAVVVLADLTLGLCVFTTVVFIEALPGFGALSAAKALGGLLVLSWLAVVAFRHRAVGLSTAHPYLTIGLVVMPGWVCASTLWAEDPATAFTAAQSWALNALLVPIVFTAVRTRRDVTLVYAVISVGTLVSAAFGLFSILGGGGRLAGAGINPNQLGGLLLIGVVFALVLAARRGTATRALWGATAVVCALALALTLSRGAIIGLLVCLVAAPLLAGRGRRAPMLFAGLLIAGTLVMTVLTLVPAQDATRLFEDRSGSGRTDIWAIGLRMAQDNAVIGVGAANFDEHTTRYLLQPGVIEEDHYLVDVPDIVPHNIFLQAWAELGLIGLGLFLALIAASLACALRAARTFAATGDRTGELFARGLLIASLGFLAFEFFSSQMYSKALWLLLALGPALLAAARQGRAGTA